MTTRTTSGRYRPARTRVKRPLFTCTGWRMISSRRFAPSISTKIRGGRFLPGSAGRKFASYFASASMSITTRVYSSLVQ
jgi:hypothetical protein